MPITCSLMLMNQGLIEIEKQQGRVGIVAKMLIHELVDLTIVFGSGMPGGATN